MQGEISLPYQNLARRSAFPHAAPLQKKKQTAIIVANPGIAALANPISLCISQFLAIQLVLSLPAQLETDLQFALCETSHKSKR